jgi:hypothetical protein
MASPLSERLQILENLLETFTREFIQLKQELEASQKKASQAPAVKEPEIRPSPTKGMTIDKEATVVSEGFFSEESLEVNYQPQPRKGFAIDKEATVVSEGFFNEESPDVNYQPQPRKGFAIDKEATVVSEGFFSEESPEVNYQPQLRKGLAIDKEATVVSDSFFYEELNAPGEWDDLQKELDPKQATVAFDFPLEENQPTPQPPAKPVEQKSPSPKNLPDPWT